MTEPERAPISVPVSTVQGWPEIAPNLEAGAASVRAVGGEVVLTDGSGNRAPSPEEVGPGVVRLSYPGEQWLRVIGAPFVPLARYTRTLAPPGRGYGPLVARSTPAKLWLLYSQGVGQFIGYLAGPSDSPGKVQ